jgi:hypothetical protein
VLKIKMKYANTPGLLILHGCVKNKAEEANTPEVLVLHSCGKEKTEVRKHRRAINFAWKW